MFVKFTASRFALRETLELAAQRSTQIAILVAIAVLGVSGPFDTNETLGPVLSFVYWAVVVISTLFTGNFFGRLMVAKIALDRKPTGIQLTVIVAAVAVVVTTLVQLINWVAFGFPPVPAAEAGGLFFRVFVVVLAVSILMVLIYLGSGRIQTADAETKKSPKILERLEFDRRGELISLSVTDHYVEVTTNKGQSLILMRLRDAISEAEGVNGLQVHRSHWVAIQQIKSARRVGNKAVLTMSNRREIPASRTYVKDLRTAGVLT